MPGEVQDGVGVEPDEPFDELVGLLVGVALGGFPARIHQVPELRLVHHPTSIGPAPVGRTWSAADRYER